MTIQAAQSAHARSAGDAAVRLVDAARSLMFEAGGPTFTVSQVVTAAGSSLKSFYRCFESKDELLVALFENDARLGAAALATMVDEADPADRLRTAVVGLFRFISLDGKLPYAAALVSEHLRLAQARPGELRSVMAPFVSVFERELSEAQRRGTVRPGDPARDAQMLFHVVMSHLHALICNQIDGAPTRVADELWAFCAAAWRPLETAR